MRITTRSAIDISESLAGFILGSHIYHTRGSDPKFERRMDRVYTAKYTIADLFIPEKNTAFEAKSVEHGVSALKGVLQCSVYLEQSDKAILVMQKPRRSALANAIESMAEAHDVGVIWLVGVPTICSEKTIRRATGGCTKPFELWRQNRYSSTKSAIMQKSRSEWADEYLETLEQVVIEKESEIFEYAVAPEPNGRGFSSIY